MRFYPGEEKRVDSWEGKRVRPTAAGGWWSDINPAAQVKPSPAPYPTPTPNPNPNPNPNQVSPPPPRVASWPSVVLTAPSTLES